MSRDQLKRLKELETENQRLKRVLADLSLYKMILTEAARGTEVKKKQSQPGPKNRVKAAIRCGTHQSLMCGQTGLMHLQLLLTQHFLAVAADFLLRCSLRRGSGRSKLQIR
jgi:hypothetical protein